MQARRICRAVRHHIDHQRAFADVQTVFFGQGFIKVLIRHAQAHIAWRKPELPTRPAKLKAGAAVALAPAKAKPEGAQRVQIRRADGDLLALAVALHRQRDLCIIVQAFQQVGQVPGVCGFAVNRGDDIPGLQARRCQWAALAEGHHLPLLAIKQDDIAHHHRHGIVARPQRHGHILGLAIAADAQRDFVARFPRLNRLDHSGGVLNCFALHRRDDIPGFKTSLRSRGVVVDLGDHGAFIAVFQPDPQVSPLAQQRPHANGWPRRSRRIFAQCGFQRQRFVIAQHLQRDAVACRQFAEPIPQRFGVHRLAIERRDDVAAFQAGLRRRAVFQHLSHLHALIGGFKGDAQVRPRCVVIALCARQGTPQHQRQGCEHQQQNTQLSVVHIHTTPFQ